MLIGTKHSGYSRANIRLYFDPVTIMAAGAGEVAAISAAEIAAQQAIAAATAEAAMIASAEAAALQATQAAAATAAETGAITAAEAGAIQANNIAAGQAVAADAATQAGIMQVGGPSAPLTTATEVNAAATQAGKNVVPEVVSRGIPAAPSAVPQVVNPDLAAGPYMPEQAGPYPYATDAYNTPLPKEPPSSLMKGLNSAMNWAKENKFETAVGAYTGAKALGLLDPDGQTFNDKPYDGPLSKYRLSPDFQGSTATPNIYQPTYPTYAAGGIMNAGPVQSMSDQNNAMGYQQAMAATGGQVANFVKGGRTGSMTDSLDYYKSMMDGKAPAAPSDRADVGIFRDSDPDTMYQDALTAAQIRNAKVNKRANLSVPSMKRPTPMGRINLAAPGIKSSDKEDVKEAAAGGIMGASSLGGYAAGGNPRLLRGPGDGMSDNIPATIGKKQPARLADGEFVIPADVVSHLGNGSTEAGAKRLHEMMSKVRRDRTGNSKQGKQIVASKYMPK